MTLADILIENYQTSNIEESSRSDLDKKTYRVINEGLVSLPRFVVTNVAEYYFHHEKEFWLLKDFPYPRPPFDKMWIEYKFPKESRSSEVSGASLETPGYESFFGAFVTSAEENTWILAGSTYAVAQGSHKVKIGPTEVMRFDLDQDGLINRVWRRVEDERSVDAHTTMLYLFHPILMALSFTNCRNIEIVEVTATEKLQKARKKRGKPPKQPFKVINILPFGKVFRSSNRTMVSEDGKIDFIIRRGSYGKYGPKFGRGLLFGKYEGMFWRPATKDRGRTYEVKA